MTDAEFLDDMERRDGGLFTTVERQRLYRLEDGCNCVMSDDTHQLFTKTLVVRARERLKRIAIERIKESA